MINFFDKVAQDIGRVTRESIEQFGSITIFFWRVILASPATIKRFHLIVEQMMLLGVCSIPIVFLVSLFVGAISAWQVQYLFADAIPLNYLGAAVGKAVFTELGPVLTAVVVTGRIGAKLAAELGTMRVTEQIDALTCLSMDPYSYLLAPRMIAGVIMLPILTIFSSFFAIVSAQLLSQYALGLSGAAFYHGMKLLFKVQDVVVCLTKAFVFGGVISLSGCYYGFLTRGGAVGVGNSTKKAVVAAMVLILATNLLVVSILL
jgi:phospholipid/cholesterol/gamma-HCH transport system permease protein